MTVYELVEKLGGEITRGRARVRLDSQWIILGQLNGDNMEFTEAGRQLAAESNVMPAESAKKQARPAKTSVVKSDEPAADVEFTAAFKNLDD